MRRFLIISALFIAVVLVIFDGMGPQNVNAQDTAPVDAGVQSPEKTGEPKSVLERRETRLRWAEDNYGVDVKTTATASRLITGQGAMPHEALEKRLTGYLRGKKMYILATSLDNKPLTSTIDLVFDREVMTLSAGSERPTEKLFHLKDNPYVSVQFHKNPPYSDLVSLQIRGKATVFRGPFCKPGTGPSEEQKLMTVYDGPEVDVPCEKIDPPPEVQTFLRLYTYQYMPWLEINAKNVVMTIPALLMGQVIEMMMMNTMDITVIQIDQVVIHDESLAKEGYNTRQLWVRGQ
jgi:hypothetical protein